MDERHCEESSLHHKAINHIMREIDSLSIMLEDVGTRFQRIEGRVQQILQTENEKNNFDKFSEDEDEIEIEVFPRFCIPPFRNDITLEDFSDWLECLERCFYFSCIPPDEQVSVAAESLQKDEEVSSWWEQIQELTRKIDDKPIEWAEMKKMLMARFLSLDDCK